MFKTLAVGAGATFAGLYAYHNYTQPPTRKIQNMPTVLPSRAEHLKTLKTPREFDVLVIGMIHYIAICQPLQVEGLLDVVLPLMLQPEGCQLPLWREMIFQAVGVAVLVVQLFTWTRNKQQINKAIAWYDHSDITCLLN